MFTRLSDKPDHPAVEKEILAWWEAEGIFRKLRERSGSSDGDERSVSTDSGSDRLAPDAVAEAQDSIVKRKQEVSNILEGETGNEIWSLLILAARLEEANAQAAASAEPAFLAKYTFNLARAFNLFYHRHRIIGEENEVKRAVLIAVADFTRRQLTTALATLGIEVPERM